MRLLNVHTLELKEFSEGQIPPYYILSHRWGEDEVSYKEYRKGNNSGRLGYQKIVGFCSFVEKLPPLKGQHIIWVWIDTCCIDKRSSAELSEAINSMMRWYGLAAKCFVHLNDVNFGPSKEADVSEILRRIAPSSWFTRGWTLQELLAPYNVIFCDTDWNVLGHICDDCALRGQTRHSCVGGYSPSLAKEIGSITGIPVMYLTEPYTVFDAPIAEVMSWAANRRTTRVEDRAYSLIGLFQINMPLLYGEGSRAFLRLQEEIIKRSTDQSIFAWKSRRRDGQVLSSILAESPDCFRWLQSIGTGWHLVSSWGKTTRTATRHFTITNRGLEIRTKLAVARDLTVKGLPSEGLPYGICLMELNCELRSRDSYASDATASSGKKPVFIALTRVFPESGEQHPKYCRVRPKILYENERSQRMLPEEIVNITTDELFDKDFAVMVDAFLS